MHCQADSNGRVTEFFESLGASGKAVCCCITFLGGCVLLS